MYLIDSASRVDGRFVGRKNGWEYDITSSDLGEEIERIITRTARTCNTSLNRSAHTHESGETFVGACNWSRIFSYEWTSSIGFRTIYVGADIGYIGRPVVITIRIIDDLDNNLCKGGIADSIPYDERNRIDSGLLECMSRMCLTRIRTVFEIPTVGISGLASCDKRSEAHQERFISPDRIGLDTEREPVLGTDVDLIVRCGRPTIPICHGHLHEPDSCSFEIEII